MFVIEQKKYYRHLLLRKCLGINNRVFFPDYSIT